MSTKDPGTPACPSCGSPDPHLFPAVQEGGEVATCPDAFHSVCAHCPHPAHEGRVCFEWVHGPEVNTVVPSRACGCVADLFAEMRDAKRTCEVFRRRDETQLDSIRTIAVQRDKAEADLAFVTDQYNHLVNGHGMGPCAAAGAPAAVGADSIAPEVPVLPKWAASAASTFELVTKLEKAPDARARAHAWTVEHAGWAMHGGGRWCGHPRDYGAPSHSATCDAATVLFDAFDRKADRVEGLRKALASALAFIAQVGETPWQLSDEKGLVFCPSCGMAHHEDTPADADVHEPVCERRAAKKLAAELLRSLGGP